jgi:ankyrin repeat protein
MATGAVVLHLTDRLDDTTLSPLAAMRDKEGRSALTYAAMAGHAEIDSDLLQVTLKEDAADPSQRDNQGKTALMHAAEKGHTNVVRAMLTGFPTRPSPAYVALVDKSGKTARQLAEENGHTAVVELLKK